MPVLVALVRGTQQEKAWQEFQEALGEDCNFTLAWLRGDVRPSRHTASIRVRPPTQNSTDLEFLEKEPLGVEKGQHMSLLTHFWPTGEVMANFQNSV